MSTGARFSPGKIFSYVLLVLLLLWTLVPIVWMLLSSFKSLTDVLSPTPLLRFKPTLVNYIGLVSGGNNVLTYFRSSILAACPPERTVRSAPRIRRPSPVFSASTARSMSSPCCRVSSPV